MPNSAGAKKRLAQSKVRQQRNKAIKTNFKTQIKKVLKSCEDGDVAAAEEQYKVAAQKLDRAGARNIIHPNAAGRQKSRLQRHIKAAKAAK